MNTIAILPMGRSIKCASPSCNRMQQHRRRRRIRRMDKFSKQGDDELAMEKVRHIIMSNSNSSQKTTDNYACSNGNPSTSSTMNFTGQNHIIHLAALAALELFQELVEIKYSSSNAHGKLSACFNALAYAQ